MAKIVRLGDINNVQGRTVTSCQTVYVDGTLACTEGNQVIGPNEQTVTANGISTVMFEGKRVVVVGSVDQDGNVRITGSQTVFVG